jgi:hypothetical protein
VDKNEAGDRNRPIERRGRTRVAQPDHALLAWQARGTLEHWRAADHLLRREAETPAAAAHERAVALVLPHLEQFASIEALVEHWRENRYRRLGDAGDPPAETIEAWVREACRVGEGALAVDEGIVAGAALWRRARALMGQAPE